MSIFDIKLSNVSYAYSNDKGKLEVLKDVNVDVERGTLLCIVGPSGCGKTTLLKLLLNEIEPQYGEVIINEERSKEGLAYIAQDPLLLPWRTLKQNAAIGLELRKTLTSASMEYVDALIKQYGLSGFERNSPDELSGGMKQRVAIIRALASRPSILFCDEPFSAVDFVTRLELNTKFRKLCRLENITSIFVTHNIEEAIFLGDVILVLSKRPATVVAKHNRNLSVHPEDAVLCRKSPEFGELFSEIWEELGYRK